MRRLTNRLISGSQDSVHHPDERHSYGIHHDGQRDVRTCVARFGRPFPVSYNTFRWSHRPPEQTKDRDMRKGREWPPDEIDALKRMKEEGKSNKTIGKAIGVSHETVRHKFMEIEAGSKPEAGSGSGGPWTEEDMQVLRQSYADNLTLTEIRSRLSSERTPKAIQVKAGSLGLKRSSAPTDSSPAPKTTPRKSRSANRTTALVSSPPEDKDDASDRKIIAEGRIDEERIRVMALSGIPPYEAAKLTGIDLELVRERFEEHGWKDRKNASQLRIAVRKRILAEARSLLETEILHDEPEHLMVLLALCAQETSRDVAEVARIALLPLPWVERIFGRLDAEGVWPVTDRTNDDLCPSDYEIFADICRHEMTSLCRIMRTPESA